MKTIQELYEKSKEELSRLTDLTRKLEEQTEDAKDELDTIKDTLGNKEYEFNKLNETLQFMFSQGNEITLILSIIIYIIIIGSSIFTLNAIIKVNTKVIIIIFELLIGLLYKLKVKSILKKFINNKITKSNRYRNIINYISEVEKEIKRLKANIQSKEQVYTEIHSQYIEYKTKRDIAKNKVNYLEREFNLPEVLISKKEKKTNRRNI